MTDVHKYLRGELSAREMHALEKAALDDPFLADALEGLATRASLTDALDQDLSDLTSRLEGSVAEKKSRIFILPRIRIAAAVILLAGLGLIALYTSTSKQKANTVNATRPQPPAADLATAPTTKAAEPPTTQPAAAAPATAPAAAAPTTAAATPAIAKLSAAPKAPTQLRRQEPPSASRARQADVQSVADSLVYPASPPPTTPAEKDLAKMPGIPTKTDSFDYNPDLAANSSSVLQTKPLLFSGQVLDTRNRPLAGVSLFLEGKRNGTVTDGEGYFKLYVPPRDTVRKLRVDYVGYDQTSIVLNSENRLSNVITLKEHGSGLNEVVVTGLGMQRKETIAEAPSEDQKKLDSLWTRATPVIGRAAYLDYLAAGKKSLGADSSIHGTVGISFDIDQKGQLSNFKIEQSLSPVQDAGTIRLISEGPSWKLIRGKKARLLVSVSFP
jgi:cytoskeletal protein RodZ